MDSLPLAFGAKPAAKTVDITKIESTQRKVILDHSRIKSTTHSLLPRTVQRKTESTTTLTANPSPVPQLSPMPYQNSTLVMLSATKRTDRAGSSRKIGRDQIYPSRTRLS